MDEPTRGTETSAFGVGRREAHDSSPFYARFSAPVLSADETVNRPAELVRSLGDGRLFHGSIDKIGPDVLPENSVALVVTSPPYFVGKEYELAISGQADSDNRVPTTYFEYLDMLRRVLGQCVRVLEPGGRMAVNVANLGRKPYRSLSADVISILQDDLGLLLRGEVIWEKGATSTGSCAWGSFAKASNPVFRDMTERVIVAAKGRFARAKTPKARQALGLPWESTLSNDEFMETTRDVWRIDAESARRIGHPAPFPVGLPRRLIDMYTYKGDIVVDPFVGSGTALVAATRTGRIGVGFDTEHAYIELASQRLDAERYRMARIRAATVTVTVDRDDPRAQTQPQPGAGSGDDPAAPPQSGAVDQLSFGDRQEHFHAQAVAEGKKVQDIAWRHLTEAGFVDVSPKARHRSRIVEFDFLAESDHGQRWWVDVAGTFTTNRPGLQRTDTVWKLLGRLHVVASYGHEGYGRPPSQTPDYGEPVLLVTPSVPRPGTPGDKALRAIGPQQVFDVIELYDPAGLARLRHYATTASATPLPGFWTDFELAAAGLPIDH